MPFVCVFKLIPHVTSDLAGAPRRFLGEIGVPPCGAGCLGGLRNEKASREAAEGELAKECEISAELWQKCSDLATEAREAREKVAPLEKRVSDLTLESQEQSAAAERYKGEVARVEALLAEKDLALNQAQADLSRAQGEVALGHRRSEENRKRAEGKSCVSTFAFLTCGPIFLTFVLSSCFSIGLEKKVAEAASAADALKKSLDAEVADHSALEAMVASACEGLGVVASTLGSSLRSHVEALYSRAREKLREALHAGVKKALVVVSSHYVGIDLPAVSEGYVLPDDDAEAQEELQKLADATDAPGDALATNFDTEVELPTLGAQRPGS